MSATNRDLTKRHPYDSYSTPAWCTEAIAKQIHWHDGCVDVLEPCIGDGAIADVLLSKYVDYVEWAEITKGRDFLTYDFGRTFDFILTNPPFSLAQEFIDKSLTIANCVVMLLRINFLASRQRKEWWQKHPPTAIHVLTRRPSFTGKGTDATDYGWFVWDATGRQKRGLYWL
ncbi:MAG: hypothetical protein K6T78_15805 [Alicyclobacillus sp.]|nr:hypothetical protein [Alicyclobacillus sp.]